MTQGTKKLKERAYQVFKKDAAPFLKICMLYPKGKGAITHTQIEREYRKLLDQAMQNPELDLPRALKFLEGCLIQAELWELME
ncbi:hypothetical protein [Sediminitomix flava]|uniref:Uncharacterized protein n=1 Tax=Sediminitomix flava TaxID=379075 RepID=A0A315ZCR2_SEDFL|nr:hypothetical protein [Sediminitomix flava]PWJ42899.1 hypothetical protein BC781_102445 [Sediminitomix flava]